MYTLKYLSFKAFQNHNKKKKYNTEARGSDEDKKTDFAENKQGVYMSKSWAPLNTTRKSFLGYQPPALFAFFKKKGEFQI